MYIYIRIAAYIIFFYYLVEVIVSRCTTEQLMKMYNVSYFNNAHEFLVLLAQQRGKLKKVKRKKIALIFCLY